MKELIELNFNDALFVDGYSNHCVQKWGKNYVLLYGAKDRDSDPP